MAAANCDDTLTFLISAASNLDDAADDGTTALMAAAMIGLPSVAQTLIEHGADFDVANDNGDTMSTLAVKSQRCGYCDADQQGAREMSVSA